jgi:CRP-like cAMP-binding protein
LSRKYDAARRLAREVSSAELSQGAGWTIALIWYWLDAIADEAFQDFKRTRLSPHGVSHRRDLIVVPNSHDEEHRRVSPKNPGTTTSCAYPERNLRARARGVFIGKREMSSQPPNAGAVKEQRPDARAALNARRNHLLAMLPPAKLKALSPDLEQVYLTRGTCLYESGESLSHVYFPTRGIVSLGYAAANGETAEFAVVGPEGVVGVEAFLGSEKSGHRAVVQTMCTAYRMRVAVARSTFAEGGALQDVVLKYALGLLLHISQTSLCNLHHSLEQRLCRSLLQGVDRVGSNTLPMTQDVVAGLVGARRQGISEAMHKLRDRGLIAYERGSITVLDRAGVLASACECYAAVQAHLERLMGAL